MLPAVQWSIDSSFEQYRNHYHLGLLQSCGSGPQHDYSVRVLARQAFDNDCEKKITTHSRRSAVLILCWVLRWSPPERRFYEVLIQKTSLTPPHPPRMVHVHAAHVCRRRGLSIRFLVEIARSFSRSLRSMACLQSEGSDGKGPRSKPIVESPRTPPRQRQCEMSTKWKRQFPPHLTHCLLLLSKCGRGDWICPEHTANGSLLRSLTSVRSVHRAGGRPTDQVEKVNQRWLTRSPRRRRSI